MLMSTLERIEHGITSLTTRVGALMAWASLLMMLLAIAVVALRYAFNYGSIALQESVIYLHALIFMLSAAVTLRLDRHVRVDVIYRHCSNKTQAAINLFGTLFLLIPTISFIGWASWDYIMISWKIQESSGDAGGLPYVYLLKGAILLFVLLLGLQSVAEVIRSIRILVNPL